MLRQMYADGQLKKRDRRSLLWHPGAISFILDRDQLSILGRLLKHKKKDGLRN
jgi:hypothetical protein